MKSQLNIAFFGNTNNYPLLLAEGVSALGHNVRLILNSKEVLHRPEGRYPQWLGNYPSWIVDCAYVQDEDIAYETQALDEVIHHLTHDVDLVILNDSGPALAGYLRSPYIALLTGSDLAYYANFDSLPLRTSMWEPGYKRSVFGRRYLRKMADFVARQRDGILGAQVVCYGQRGLVPEGDRLLDEIGVTDQQRWMLYFSNVNGLTAKSFPHNEKLRILCGSRILYRPECNPAFSAMDFKGSDVLLRGFAEYCRRGGQGELRLPQKGQDLDAARELIRELAIHDRIVWLPETPLAQFYEEMAAADLVCDQFGTSFPGMVAADAYAIGRPVMANLRNEIFGQILPEPLPGFNATTPEEIARVLLEVESDRSLLASIGESCRAYAETFLSPELVAKRLLERATQGSV